MRLMEAAMHNRRTTAAAWLRALEFNEGDEPAELPQITVPDDLSALPVDELDELHELLAQTIDEVSRGPVDTEVLAYLTDLAAGYEKVEAEQAHRAEAAEAIATQVEALRTKVLGKVEEGDDPDNADDPDAEPVTDPGEVPEPDAEQPDADGGVEVRPPPQEQGQPAAQPESQHQAVAASSRLPLGTVSRSAPRPRMNRDTGRVTITAAADVPGISTGGRVPNMLKLAEMASAKASRLADKQSADLATIEYPIDNWVEPGMTPDQQAEVFDKATAAGRTMQSLVAAGGWCGPLEPIFDLMRVDASDGLLRLPTIGIRRGGIQVPSPLVLPADLSTLSFVWTNQNDIDAGLVGAPDPTKPCIRIPCPTWTPYSTTAYGICVTHGNLADRSFPELTREYIGMVTNAHGHYLSSVDIAAIAAASTAIAGPVIVGTAPTVLADLELAIEFYRSKYRMGMNQPMELVAPHWLLSVLRGDMAAARGIDAQNVSDAEITADLRERGANPQFVQDWQLLANATAFPASVQYLLYPAGTWAIGTQGRLDLGVQRDSALNAVNDFTAMFTEEFRVLVKLGAESLRVTSTIAVDGRVNTKTATA
jgi:hypothetical protein